MNLSLRGILSNEYIFLNNASGVAKIKIRLLYKNRILVQLDHQPGNVTKGRGKKWVTIIVAMKL